MALNESEWVTRAECAKGELWLDAWFPDTSQGYGAKEARRVCRHCPVKKECRLAGKPEKHGIWAGVYHTETIAVTPKDAILDAAGSMRRLQALATLGWPSKEVAADIRRYTGIRVNPRLLDNIRAGVEDKIPEPLIEAITRAYRHMHTTANSGTSASATISHALSNQWSAPRAWRGIDIDNPGAEPGYDEFA